MIVKDEEERIGSCLESVRDEVDEMIIVDTGSTDRTKEICRSYGAHVYEYGWKGDFSDARNYGLERATGDWILWLDADEEVDQQDRYRLRYALKQEDVDLYTISLINYYGDFPPDPDKAFLIAQHRLFRNQKGFRFKNKIHEVLNIDEVLVSPEETKRLQRLPVKVYHYGYMEEVTENKKKFERNLSMLQKELDESKNPDPWVYYHMASEYYRVKEYEKSFEFVNNAILNFIFSGKKPPSLLYKLKYSILLNVGSIDGGLPAIDKAIELYPDYVDLHFYRGVFLFIKEEYTEALETFERCLDVGEDQPHHLILKGLGSFQAIYYKGLCMEKMGKLQQAVHYYVQSLQLSPTNDSAIESLQDLLTKHPDLISEVKDLECLKLIMPNSSDR
ncbi:glycosyltransferase [Rossellomorea sp. YC4-1]|nr:glycosyltransferase [Rossellomorea sp. YC4-1]